jgi:hypothetical protein
VRANRDPAEDVGGSTPRRSINRSVGAAMADPRNLPPLHDDREPTDVPNWIGRIIVTLLFLAALAVIVLSAVLGR